MTVTYALVLGIALGWIMAEGGVALLVWTDARRDRHRDEAGATSLAAVLVPALLFLVGLAIVAVMAR